MNRIGFMKVAASGAAGLLSGKRSIGQMLKEPVVRAEISGIKPISGSWFEFQHLLPLEGKYWDPALKLYSADQWKQVVKEISEIGFEYLVLQEIALDGKTFYPSKLAPKFQLACEDPLEAVLTAADEYGVKFFIGNDFWDDVHKGEFLMKDAGIRKLREKAMHEVAERYGHHRSFHGWYFPNEAYLMPYFDEAFIEYVNDCSRIAKTLMPDSVNIIAPYNIKMEKNDLKFVRQLEKLNIDIIAYQDGIGVLSTKPGEPALFYEHLSRAHQRASRARIWADIELFYFEETTKGNLLPAEFPRILQQMKEVSPFVDKILCYQYQGQMNKPGTGVYAGHGSKNSVRLYEDYSGWLAKQPKVAE